MTPRNRRRLVAALLACVVVLSSCNAFAESNTSSPIDEETSPAVEAFGVATAADLIAAMGAVRVRNCMEEAGFLWWPVPGNERIRLSVDVEGRPVFSDAWSERYGFGISTQAISQGLAGDGLAGFDNRDFAQIDDSQNRDYVADLNSVRRSEYEEVLFGTGEAGLDGCRVRALDELEDPDLLAFERELRDLGERIETDPEVTQAEATVASCMAAAGLDYTTRPDTLALFTSETEPIQRSVEGGIEAISGMSDQELAAIPDDELEAMLNNDPRLPDASKVALAELQEREVAVVLALNACGGGLDPASELSRIRHGVRFRVEQELVDARNDLRTLALKQGLVAG